VTRERRLANGKIIGAVALTNGALSYILKNRHYLGELNHHGRSWPAEHEPIVDAGLFDAVQARLADNLNRAANRKAKSGALLMSKIFDDRGNPMSPSHAVKKGARYRYYVSSPIAQGRKDEAGSIARVPAEPIEQLVLSELRRGGGDRRQTALSDRDVIVAELDRLVIRADHIEIRRTDEVMDDASDVILVDWRKPSSTRRRDIILPETSDGPIRPIRVDEQVRLLKAIALARRWLDELVAGTVADVSGLARREKRTERSIRMMLSLAFLDPAIIKAAVDGRLPRGQASHGLLIFPWPSSTNGPRSDLFVRPDQSRNESQRNVKARPMKPLVRRRLGVFPPGNIGIKPVSAVVEPVSSGRLKTLDGK
jgi:hypothetical protein